LPSGGKIKDPSKLQASEVDSLLQFWGARQDAGDDSVFLFRRWQDKDKEMRLPVKEQTTDQSSSEASPSKRNKGTKQVTLAKGRGKQHGKRSSRRRLESDTDDDTDSCQDDDNFPDVLAGRSASKTQESDIAQSPSVANSAVPDGTGVRQSRRQDAVAKALPAAKSKLASVVLRKRVGDVNDSSEDEHPAKNSKTPTSHAFGPRSGGKHKTQDVRLLPAPVQQMPAAESNMPSVGVKRKRAGDVDNGREDGRPAKKPKAATVGRSFGPSSSGKKKTQDNAKKRLPDAASDIPARRTRSQVAKEPQKAIGGRRTRK
jgi:hypothetical protein